MKKILGLVVIILILVFPVSGSDNLSDNLTIPNTFNYGETISSSKINENFQILADRMSSLIEIGNGSIVIGNFQIISTVVYNTDTVNFKYPFKDQVDADYRCYFVGGGSSGGGTNIDAGATSYSYSSTCERLTFSAQGFIAR